MCKQFTMWLIVVHFGLTSTLSNLSPIRTQFRFRTEFANYFTLVREASRLDVKFVRKVILSSSMYDRE